MECGYFKYCYGYLNLKCLRLFWRNIKLLLKYMEESILKLQLLEKKDLVEPEIDIRYSSMTQPLNRIVQYIRQQEYLIQGIFEKKLYQIPLNEVLYFETVDKKTFMYTQQKIFECKKTLSAIEQDLIRSNVVRISKTALLNISCLVCVKPYPNHRLLAELNNEENLIVSRKYIPILRDKIRSGYYE